jgi:hypothetical protein
LEVGDHETVGASFLEWSDKTVSPCFEERGTLLTIGASFGSARLISVPSMRKFEPNVSEEILSEDSGFSDGRLTSRAVSLSDDESHTQSLAW